MANLCFETTHMFLFTSEGLSLTSCHANPRFRSQRPLAGVDSTLLVFDQGLETGIDVSITDLALAKMSS